MTENAYCELECKSNFSFLRGASHPEELVARAAELGLGALALNDHDGVYGIPKAWWRAKDIPIRLISGASIPLESHPRLTLLARDRAGYGLLCRLLTAAHAGKEKGRALLRWSELESFLSEPAAGGGLFVLAPLEADLSRLQPLLRKEQLFLTLHRLLDGHDRARTERALWLRARFGVPLVATNDVHYHCRERARLQDALVAIRENSPLQKLGHALFPNPERHLKSPAGMRALFRDLPEAIAATNAIAQACSFQPGELRYRYPSEWIPAEHSAQSHLEQLSWEGARRRYGEVPEQVKAQLRKELALIAKLAYADYFLTIHDIVAEARRRDILCQGRGAAANSSVCFCLGITAVDPTKVHLLFERFLSEERNEPPDIDVDFEHERREEILQYIYEKYGRHRAAMISAVVTYRSRSALRELARAMGLEVGTLSARKLEKQLAERAARAECHEAPRLISELSGEMSGFPRHLSIHSGGFTLSADPITEIVPVEPARKEGRTIIQWDKYDLDYLGLLKVDLLSLGMLSALHRTLRLVNKELHSLDPEMSDPATYEMIQKADTVGTFQIESRAQMSMLGRLQPKNYYDLVVEVAIVRPGPIVGGMVHPYLRRRRGLEPIEIPHPKLEPILRRTLGVPLFQEQVMEIAVELAGFTPGEADRLRRAIGAWRASGEMRPMAERLRSGLLAGGLSPAFAERILQQISGFAEYGFPESHAASFAMLAYASCYLKRHHPAEFCCGLLNSLPMGFYQAHSLVDDAKLHGVKVLPVSLNASDWECRIEAPGTIRLGWNMVNGLGAPEAAKLIASRPFSSLPDFLQRTRLRRDLLFRLAMGGSFSPFGLEPREALWEILERRRRHEPVQGDLFLDLPQSSRPQHAARLPPLSEFERIREEYDSFSLSTRGHPMQALRQILKLPKLNTRSAKALRHGSPLSVAGLALVRQRPPTANKMTFSTLEDEFGLLDLAIAPGVYARVKEIFLENCFLEARGKLQRDGNSFSLWVLDLRPLWKESEPLVIEPAQYFH